METSAVNDIYLHLVKGSARTVKRGGQGSYGRVTPRIIDVASVDFGNTHVCFSDSVAERSKLGKTKRADCRLATLLNENTVGMWREIILTGVAAGFNVAASHKVGGAPQLFFGGATLAWLSTVARYVGKELPPRTAGTCGMQ